MRLTLATLLAYLDNVLEPADSQALAEKIEKSDFASGLVMRIRSISRKLRMGAPKVEGKGLGRDPNSVAEYLDGSLAPERIGEFERLCLESDVQLAEVASCHQVLAMVLNKPAEVPPQVRERIYALANQAEAARLAAPNRIDGAHTSAESDGAHPAPPKPSSAATSAAHLVPPSDNGKSHTEPVPPPVGRAMEVPDYLRAGQKSGGWLWLAGLAAVLLLAVGALRMMGPFDGTHPLAQMMGQGPAQVATGPGPEQTNPQPTLPAQLESGNSETTAVPPGPGDAASRPTLSGDELPPLAPPTPIEAAPAEPPPAEPMPPAPKPVDEMPPELKTADPKPAEGDVIASRPLVPPPPKPIPGTLPGPMPVDPNQPAASELPIPPKPAEPMPAEPEDGSETADVGRYMSDEQLLVHLVDEPKMKTQLWYRLAPRTMLAANERLVVLPSYRPQITLPSGIQATFVGESSFRMQKPMQAGSARMAIEYGRVVLVSLGAAGGQVELDLAGLKGTVMLADADAAVAIEVRRYLPPGVAADDPKAELIRVVDLFALGGRVVWQPADQAPLDIPVSQVVIYAGEELPRVGGPYAIPEWIDAKSLPDIERRASIDMEAELPLDKPLDITLAEHAVGRKIEVRSLAARSLAALDQFQPLLSELNDPRQYAYWASDIDSLKFALARSSEAAGKVYATLQNQRPANAKLMYDMLLGATDEQLTEGTAGEWVNALESNELDVRVLALDSLRRVTGLMKMYRPEKPLAMNSTSIQRWKELLNENQVIHKEPHSPFNRYSQPAVDEAPKGRTP